MNKTVHLVSLGCPKNLVDSEVMLGQLAQAGYTVEEDPARADLLLLNTCGFIQPAVEEAIDEILRLGEFKRNDSSKLFAVTGCLVQRYGADLAAEFPEVDLFTGTDGFQDLLLLLSRTTQGEKPVLELRPANYVMANITPRLLSTPPFRAYQKITEGCDNRCSYCMIPAIRGKLRSRDLNDLVREAIRLEQGGVKELSLIAQDLTAYGRDLGDESNLIRLLETLLANTTIPWIRLLYLYPSSITAPLLQLMACERRLLPYLDIPFQHVSDSVLRRMNRHYSQQSIEDILSNIRQQVPEAVIRTTLMVGFPGESNDDMSELLDFLQRHQLDHVGVFTYADEEGSAAIQLPEKIPEAEKALRYNQVMAVQAEIAARRQLRYIGRVEEVLVEGISRESDLLLEGRTRFQAPDVDGCVYITDGTATPGDIVSVRISEAHTYDLAGPIVTC